jgi:hypothetical protein
MCAAEEIPNCDDISRLIEFPRTYSREREIILEIGFEFPGGSGESVIWRKYAPTDEDVHAIGAQWEQKKRERRDETRYVGFATNTAGTVRGFRTARGHGFDVVHVPDEGKYHAEVRYSPATVVPLIKPDRAELRLAIAKMFSTLVPCPAGS